MKKKTRLYILRSVEGHKAWSPWYDKAFGFVVRAVDEASARQFAAENCGDEGEKSWLDHQASTCNLLTESGEIGIVIKDFYSFSA